MKNKTMKKEVNYMSVADFAEAKGVKTQTVYNWESEGLISFDVHEKYKGWVIDFEKYKNILPRKRGVKTFKETLNALSNKGK